MTVWVAVALHDPDYALALAERIREQLRQDGVEAGVGVGADLADVQADANGSS